MEWPFQDNLGEIKVFKNQWLPRGLIENFLVPRIKEMEEVRRV